MKKTDLEKQKALKLKGKLNAGNPLNRLADTVPAVDRREQRRLDQAAGLVSFPVKLHQPLIAALNAKAQADSISVNELVNTLLAEALKD
ncbi:hypothetical protein [Pusillimonas sp. ANT_WB101]|uniref:hypothetical protein n=1 Tax=Pusillimonas sp. ANT_WB101 TaxID=2597356 RepID=UPI0011F08BF6|nr:hypothetical protein [Pusillimonas sp. ANT_WB101]KAA0911855.1 hypothetical protein FQ179_08720 [Pusillimonas sp. ANT_WB101]